MGGAASGPAGWGRGRRPWGQSGAQSLGHRPTHVQAGGRPALPTSPSQQCPEYEDMVAAGLGLRLRARSPLWQRPGALNFHRGDNQRGAKHCTPRLHQDTASTSRLLSGVHADRQRAMVTKPLYSPAPGWERADGGSSALGVLEAPLRGVGRLGWQDTRAVPSAPLGTVGACRPSAPCPVAAG